MPPAPPPSTALRVNGQVHAVAVDGRAPLLNVLRNDLGLNGPKYGCGLGECGACTVLVDGVAARACVLPLAGVAGREVTTLEGLADAAGHLHPVQQAFVATQAAQCGYCLNGMVMTTVALLRRDPRPSEAQMRAALSHNLCRCGTHLEILAAVRLAAEAAPCQTETHGSGPGPSRRPDSGLDPVGDMTPGSAASASEPRA